LFEVAVQIARLTDRRRARKAAMAALADDEASPIEQPEPIDPAAAFGEPAGKSARPVSDYSDTL
ncbi:twin-arginine translocase subunit TatC, partial [Klebsiella pneumoniae]|nr:twin-arginine translocase subunit TatC [Klebsiella pneumoniae]